MLEIRCPDITSSDGTFGDKMSVGKKRLEGQNVCGKNVWWDKTSGGTKRPEGKNIWRDKTSGGTKHPATERPARRDKMSVGTKRPWEKTSGRKKVPLLNSHNLISRRISSYSIIRLFSND
jgi:hypothetical protein